jgi:hypothetical protein
MRKQVTMKPSNIKPWHPEQIKQALLAQAADCQKLAERIVEYTNKDATHFDNHDLSLIRSAMLPALEEATHMLIVAFLTGKSRHAQDDLDRIHSMLKTSTRL